MLQFSVYTNPRPPGFEVKAVVSFSRIGITQQEYLNTLEKLRIKLEDTLPPSYRAKYRIDDERLTVTANIRLSSHVQRAAYLMEEYIRSSAAALKLVDCPPPGGHPDPEN